MRWIEHNTIVKVTDYTSIVYSVLEAVPRAFVSFIYLIPYDVGTNIILILLTRTQRQSKSNGSQGHASRIPKPGNVTPKSCLSHQAILPFHTNGKADKEGKWEHPFSVQVSERALSLPYRRGESVGTHLALLCPLTHSLLCGKQGDVLIAKTGRGR